MNQLCENFKTHLENICLGHLSRHAGSPGELAAAEYIERVFRSYGMDCRREYFPIRGWEYSGFSLRNATKGWAVPTAQVCHFSGTVHATQKLLVLPGYDVDAPDFPDVKDQICFVPDAKYVLENNALALELENRGALAVIFSQLIDHCGMPSTKIVRPADTQRIGLCAVATIGAAHIAANLDDEYTLDIDARPYDGQAFNIVATLGEGEHLVTIGAHMDGAPVIDAASDDAAGVAIVLELARELHGKTGDCRAEFVAFSAEEYIEKPGLCPPGSSDYVARHKDAVRWFLNVDGGALPLLYAPTSTLHVGQRDKLPAIDYPQEIFPVRHAGDDKTFDYAGIPTIWLREESAFKVQSLHTAVDCMNIVDYPAMAKRYAVIKDVAEKLLAATK